MIRLFKLLARPLYRGIRIFFKVRWIKTLYINFSLLPFKYATKLPIVVLCQLKIGSLKGTVIFENPENIKFGRVQIGRDIDNMPIAGVSSRLSIGGKLFFENSAAFSPGAQLIVWPDSEMYIGNKVVLGAGVILKSTLNVYVGKFTRIASGCFVMDSNVHIIKDTITGEVKPINKPIRIGNYCWITMNSAIMAGAVLPNFSIVARNSIVNRNFSAEGLGVLLAGSPAKVVTKNRQRLFDQNMEHWVNKFFRENPFAKSYKMEPGFTTPDEADYFRISEI